MSRIQPPQINDKLLTQSVFNQESSWSDEDAWEVEDYLEDDSFDSWFSADSSTWQTENFLAPFGGAQINDHPPVTHGSIVTESFTITQMINGSELRWLWDVATDNNTGNVSIGMSVYHNGTFAGGASGFVNENGATMYGVDANGNITATYTMAPGSLPKAPAYDGNLDLQILEGTNKIYLDASVENSDEFISTQIVGSASFELQQFYG
ncbi:hypothetical protein [Pseudoduganella lutea]|uniref:Uncharacterized protein n=1 Tax=Pseudoduganella lutea TaxID=321985 RepID=A0A4P6KU07_9BURK|nr:hypothetical protein [Pseudoduganella lutea]QBE62095.1 hypothetical protein EWM63_03115 [Pseudoduganella lutea]